MIKFALFQTSSGNFAFAQILKGMLLIQFFCLLNQPLVKVQIKFLLYLTIWVVLVNVLYNYSMHNTVSLNLLAVIHINGCEDIELINSLTLINCAVVGLVVFIYLFIFICIYQLIVVNVNHLIEYSLHDFFN